MIHEECFQLFRSIALRDDLIRDLMNGPMQTMVDTFTSRTFPLLIIFRFGKEQFEESNYVDSTICAKAVSKLVQLRVSSIVGAP